MASWLEHVYSLLIPTIYDLITLELVLREDKNLVADITASETGYLHGRPKECYLDTEAEGIIGLSVYEAFHLADAHETGMLQLHVYLKALFCLPPTILEVVEIKFEFRQIFVLFIGISSINRNLLRFFIHHIGCHTIIPRGIAFLAISHFLAFITDVACGLVDTDNIHIIMQCGTLRTKYHLISTIEYVACLLGVIACLRRPKYTLYEQK